VSFDPTDDFELAPCGLLSTRPDGLILRVNQTLSSWLGTPREALVQRKRFEDVLSLPGRLFHGTHFAPLLQMQGFVDEIALEMRRPDGSGLQVLVSATLTKDEAGQPLGVRIAVFRASERRRYEEELLRSRYVQAEQLAAIVRSSRDAIISISSLGVIQTWNEAAVRLYGYSADQAVSSQLSMLAPDDQAAEDQAFLARLLGGESLLLEARRRRLDGQLVPVAISGAPVRGTDGRVVGAATVHRDMSAWREAEERRSLMLRELTHRTKNLLAIVQAVERQSAATTTSKEEFHERLSGRLRAIAASHDMLLLCEWRGVVVAEVLRSQLAPFAEINRLRIHSEGPALQLNADASHNLALAIHELATNAVKYGALSGLTGEVFISWGLVDGSPGPPIFELRWSERGGPPVAPPSRRGFGLTVLERIVPSALDGSATLSLEPPGALWTIRIPARLLEPLPA
jgi:PAS domain S-box-containing protein